jgi:phosphoglycolate phosphatase
MSAMADGLLSTPTSGCSRRWDAFDVYVFDIDGTLLHCRDAVHYFAFCETLTALAGRPLTLEGVVAHGNTDLGILRDALALARIPDGQWRPHLDRIQEMMCSAVAKREQEFRVEVLPQVPAVLRYLHSRGALLGLATGNLRGIGERKLHRARLAEYFSFAAWSDNYETRTDVFSNAVQRARALAGTGASICVVGDTPADAMAARANGLPVIAVATGVHSDEQLRRSEPDWCVGCLEELLGPAQPLLA